VKYVPKWFPGAGFRRYAAEMKLLQREMRDRPVEATQTQMVRYSTNDVGQQFLSVLTHDGCALLDQWHCPGLNGSAYA
jgi:hypothetical protein